MQKAVTALFICNSNKIRAVYAVFPLIGVRLSDLVAFLQEHAL